MHIEYTTEGPVATLRLNRPDRLNALSEEMKETLGDHLERLRRDASIKVVVLCANGKAFCASGDVSTMGDFTPTTAMDRLRRAHRVITGLASLDQLVIASVRGAVAGSGWSMALACDVIVASETAVFSQVFKNVGLMPDCGALWFLSQHLGPLRAKELMFTGRKLPAAEALALGLVTSLVPDASLDEETARWAALLSTGPTLAYSMTKKMYRQMAAPSLEQALDSEAWAQSLALVSEDHREGIQAFRERRSPRFQGR